MSSFSLGVTAVMLPEMDFTAQIELCRSLGIHYYQYRPRVVPEASRVEVYDNPWGNHRFDLTPLGLLHDGAKLTAQLRSAGMEPWGTVPALTVESDDEEIGVNIQAALAAGAGAVRCGPCAYPKHVFDYREFLGQVVTHYQRVIDELSWPSKIKLLVETHSRSLAASPALAWNIVHHFSPEQIGVIFDLSNFALEGEINPTLAVSVLRRYIDCVHVGGSRRVKPSDSDVPGGKPRVTQACALQDSDLDIVSWLRVLREANVTAPLIIEDFDPTLSGPERLKRSVDYLHRALAAIG